MSSEMREIKAMADAVEYGIALGKLDAPAVFTKMRDLLNLALLARTEAGASEAAFMAVAERLAADGISPGDLDPNATMTEHRAQCRRCGDFVAIAVPTPTVAPIADVAVAWLCEWTDEDDGETVRVSFEYKRGAESRAAEVGGDARVIPLFTHPQGASGDAVTGRVNGYMFSARAIEIITDGEVPEWITKTPGLRVTITAMQAKEAAE